MSHIRYTSIPPLRNLLREAEIDAHIAEGRDSYAEAFDEFERDRRPSVIETRPSLWARAIRYGRTFAKSFQHLAVKVVRGLGAPTKSNKGKS